MAYYLKLYAATLLAFLAIDMVWLGLVARTFYRTHLSFLMTPNPNWLAAGLFYLLFIVGLLVFAVVPGLEGDSLRTTLLRAALFGLICYATYDLTNLATVKGWPALVTVVDMLWGTALSAAVGYFGFVAGKWLAGPNIRAVASLTRVGIMEVSRSEGDTLVRKTYWRRRRAFCDIERSAIGLWKTSPVNGYSGDCALWHDLRGR